jgi:hypothetical protein
MTCQEGVWSKSRLPDTGYNNNGGKHNDCEHSWAGKIHYELPCDDYSRKTKNASERHSFENS